MKLIKSHSEDVYNVTKIILNFLMFFQIFNSLKNPKKLSCFLQKKLIISECVIEDVSNGC